MQSAKSKKARVVSPTGRTLHDFFGAKPNASSPSQPQSKATTKTTKAGSYFQKCYPPEIIVIGSDSDDEPEILETTNPFKRRRLSPKNTDHYLETKLAGPSKLRPLESSPGPSAAKENSGLSSHEASAHHDLKKENVSSFGEPFHLRVGANITKEHTAPVSAFGKPLLLMSSLRDSNCETNPLLSKASIVEDGVKDSKREVAVDIDLTLDDWENGDDEALNRAEDEGSEAVCVTSTAVDAGLFVEIEDVFPAEGTSLEEWDMETTDDLRIPESDEAAPDILQSIDTLRQRNVDANKSNAGNAFSFLMSSFKENEEWKEATIAEDRSFRPAKGNGNRRKAPFYKVLQGMPIAVDAFRYGAIPGVTAYFLTHAHSDHYTNLSSTWKNGPIYCSQSTANLIVHMLSVDRKWVHPLPMDAPTLIPNTNGVIVTLIEANHCPGSCLFFFEGPQTVNAGDSAFKSHFVGTSKIFRYLHCGDFRASPRHILHPAIRGKTIDHVYLDTTYLDPKYTFPPQPLVISACAELVTRIISGQTSPDKASSMLSWISSSSSKGKGKQVSSKLLVVVGTYSIGKERIVKAIAHALNSKVYCDTKKTAILKCQADPELDALLTANPLDAIVHLVPLATIATDHLQLYLDRFKGFFDRVVGFRPTGWTYMPAAGSNQLPSISAIISKSTQHNFTWEDLNLSAKSTTTLQLYPVPYSEHSSFFELTCFAMSFSWIKMIATVNVGSESSRGKMAKWVAKWEAERKKRGKDTIIPHRHLEYW